MARVPYLETSDLAPEDQDLLKRRISLFQALVNSPKAARAFSGLGGLYTVWQQTRSAVAGTGDSASRLARALTLRVVASCQARA